MFRIVRKTTIGPDVRIRTLPRIDQPLRARRVTEEELITPVSVLLCDLYRSFLTKTDFTFLIRAHPCHPWFKRSWKN